MGGFAKLVNSVLLDPGMRGCTFKTGYYWTHYWVLFD